MVTTTDRPAAATSTAVAQRNYDRLAPWYDWLAASEHALVEAGLQLLAVQPGERVLEIGAGTGKALVALAAAVGEAGRAIAIDVSPRMIEVSRRRLQRTGLACRVHLLRGDARALPVPSASCDAVFSSFALELLAPADLDAALTECRRVLRPGGRLGVVAMAERPRPGALDRLYRWAHRRWPGAIDCRPIALGPLLTRAGLQQVAVVPRSVWGLAVDLAVARR